MTWILGVAWPWLKQYGPKLGWPLAVLFCVLWLRQGGALSACMAKAAEPAKVEAKAEQKQEAKSNTKILVKTVYVPGAPCPDLVIQADGGSEVAQSATTTATVTPLDGAQRVRISIFLGGGYVGTPYASAGLRWGKLSLMGQTTGTVHGGGATWDVWEF